jgi:hypothetical protein
MAPTADQTGRDLSLRSAPREEMERSREMVKETCSERASSEECHRPGQDSVLMLSEPRVYEAERLQMSDFSEVY